MGLRSPGKRAYLDQRVGAQFRDNEEPAALVRQIDDRVAELKRLIVDWAKR